MPSTDISLTSLGDRARFEQRDVVDADVHVSPHAWWNLFEASAKRYIAQEVGAPRAEHLRAIAEELQQRRAEWRGRTDDVDEADERAWDQVNARLWDEEPDQGSSAHSSSMLATGLDPFAPR